MFEQCVDFVISSFSETLKLPIDQVSRIGDDIPIPVFDRKTISGLLYHALGKMRANAQSLIITEGDYVIVGDIHGHLHDLFRVFDSSVLTSSEKYIFLGDYVDRGEYSVEVVILLLALVIKFPTRFILLRGNHEFRETNKIYGFKDAVEKIYDQDMWEQFNIVFDYLPFAALIDNKTLCVHAGVTQHINTIEEIAKIKLPVSKYTESSKIEDLVWSDPNEDIAYDGVTNTIRGNGVYFTCYRVAAFLKRNDLEYIIKGHINLDGVKLIFPGLVSVHTTDRAPNRAGIVKYVSNDCTVHKQRFDHINVIGHEEAFFFTAKHEEIQATTTSPTSFLPLCKFSSAGIPSSRPKISLSSAATARRGSSYHFVRHGTCSLQGRGALIQMVNRNLKSKY